MDKKVIILKNYEGRIGNAMLKKYKSIKNNGVWNAVKCICANTIKSIKITSPKNVVVIDKELANGYEVTKQLFSVLAAPKIIHIVWTFIILMGQKNLKYLIWVINQLIRLNPKYLNV